MEHIKDMIAGYLNAAIWTEEEQIRETDGIDIRDLEFSPEAEKRATEDVSGFFEATRELFSQHTRYDLVGMDLWLSRNGHGAGFFDGEQYGENADALQEAACKMGECYLYAGDDGLLHFS
jgi:hypothetical protein